MNKVWLDALNPSDEPNIGKGAIGEIANPSTADMC
jgi:hypothetical protein